MPQLPTITYPNGTRLYRWAMPDDVGRGSARATELEAEKSLIHSVFGPTAVLEHTSDGAPYIADQSGAMLCPAGLISISHTCGIVCMAVSEGSIIGIDVERVTYRTTRVRHKFLSSLEMYRIPIDDPVANTIAWTAKEAAYKAALTPGLSMSDGIMLFNPAQGEHAGRIAHCGTIVDVSFITDIAKGLVTTLAIIISPEVLYY